MEYFITQRYSNHYGVDLKNNDLTRGLQYASEMKNAQYRESGSPEKRKGYHAAASAAGGIGTFVYQRANPVTGLDETEVVCVDENLHRLKQSNLTVSYSGAEANCRISIYVDETDSHYHCQIVEGLVVVLDEDLGVGFDEATPVTLSDLSTAINAVTDFSASITGSTTVPAAFLRVSREWDLTQDDFVGIAEYWEQVNSPTSNPFSAAWADRHSDAFELVSHVNIQNNIYFGHAQNEVLKYDGNSIYRAGLPSVASLVTALGGAGSVTGTNYYHQVQYLQKDGAGQFQSGNLLTVDTGLSPSAQSMDVTVANIQAGSGFNTNCAIVAGAQVTVTTITVDDGSGGNHTMQVGDTAYFYDSVSAGYVERTVTAVGLTTITIAGAAVTVADNAVISNNLKIGIYRNLSSGTFPSVWYLVEEIPNNSFAATQVYNDDTADAGLGAEIFPPIQDRSPPKKGAYVSQWNSVMITAGDPENPTLVFYSSFEGPEYFPADSNEIIYGTAAGDPIKGIGANNEVFAIMGRNSFGVMTGDIIQNALRLEIKSEDIGCASHASIREINGALAWLSPKGPRTSSGGQVPRPLGEAVNPDGGASGASRIDPEFNSDGKTGELAYALNRAVGVHDRKTDKYLLFVPALSTTGGEVYANSNSRVYAYDYNRDAWLVWTNMNMMGGAALEPVSEDLYFSEVQFSIFASTNRFNLYRRHNLNDAWDYADNVEPIGGTLEDAWEYASQWEPLQQPSLLKKFLKLRVYALEEIANNRFNLSVIQELNYQRENTRTSFDLMLSGAGYGQSAYGTDPYGDPANSTVTHTLNRDRSTSTRFRFRNSTLHENVILTGWEIEAVTPYRVAMKS